MKIQKQQRSLLFLRLSTTRPKSHHPKSRPKQFQTQEFPEGNRGGGGRPAKDSALATRGSKYASCSARCGKQISSTPEISRKRAAKHAKSAELRVGERKRCGSPRRRHLTAQDAVLITTRKRDGSTCGCARKRDAPCR